MNEEMRVEAMELCVTACEKHSSSNEASVIMPYAIISLSQTISYSAFLTTYMTL